MSVYRNKFQRKKLITDINVVPYIDVMLVLLIIFMITVPMLIQGVNVNLPQANTNIVDGLEHNSELLVVSVNAEGKFYVAAGKKQKQPIDAEELVIKVAAVLRRRPDTFVMVKGDRSVNYGQVITVMSLLQQAGASSVGLLTEKSDIFGLPDKLYEK
ncbi:MAG: protein TolR [Piscirickettsiaceae bacterium]|nr:protein TolR [Piscirickettsiaceae bacterium]